MLRWPGGAGGDLILYIKSLSDPESVTNVKFCKNIEPTYHQLNNAIDYTCIDHLHPKEIYKIYLADWVDQVDPNELSDELRTYSYSDQIHWFKSHYYSSNRFDNITVDLVVDPLSLPFVVSSNIAKTDTLYKNFNRLAKMIADPMVRSNFAMYSIAMDNVQRQPSVISKHLPVSSLLIDTETFKTATNLVNLNLDFTFIHVYQNWRLKNQTYMPSERYQKKIQSQDYDFFDTELSIVERYCLMALSKNKFKLL
jgi:hypothetical protein